MEKCILCPTSHHFQFLKKEVGKYAKNVILKEVQKISKNPSAVHDSIIYFPKQILVHENWKKQVGDISQVNLHNMQKSNHGN